MQNFNIEGIYTYVENVKTLKLGDKVFLRLNNNNRINSESVGVYSNENKKIGYMPFNASQLDINANYTVTKIIFSRSPIVTISRIYSSENFLIYEPNILKKIKYNNTSILSSKYDNDVISFNKFLELQDIDIIKMGLIYIDSNYLVMLVKTYEGDNIFHTVTKKYYDNNIFKYDEFYQFKLLDKNIYKQFYIHRLEDYIIKNYNLLEEKKYRLPFSLKYTSEKIHANIIHNQINIDIISVVVKAIISDKYEEYFRQLNCCDLMDLFEPVKPLLLEIFKEYKPCELAYNHSMKIYTFVDMYNEDTIVDIKSDVNLEIDAYYCKKLNILNKNKYYIYNPIKGILHKYTKTN
jgi:hypothetical protein